MYSRLALRYSTFALRLNTNLYTAVPRLAAVRNFSFTSIALHEHKGHKCHHHHESGECQGHNDKHGNEKGENEKKEGACANHNNQHEHEHGHACSGHHHHGHNHSHNHSHEDHSLKMEKPMLMIAFTCKKCNARSSHVMSKQAYSSGTVLVQCPGCKARHLIADHLKIFSDHKITIEDIMKAQGQKVTQDATDLVFEDIPEKLKSAIGHYAKNAPPEFQSKENQTESPKLMAGVEETNDSDKK